MNPISKNKMELFSRLSRTPQRRKLGLFAAEGGKCVRDTLGHFRLEALVATERWLSEERALVSALGSGSVFSCSESEMKRMSALSTPPEVMAVYHLPDPPEDAGEIPPDRHVLMLDGVQDPGNLGTIVRAAHWFGMRRVYASRGTADIFSAKAIQATMGSMSAVEVVYCDLRRLILDHPGRPVYGLLLEGNDIFRHGPFEPGFIVMGSEGSGLSPELRELVDAPLTIPPADASNHPDSLNVAMATAITLAQIIR